MKLRGRAYAAERVVCGWVLGCHFDGLTDSDAKRAGVLSMLLVSNRRVVHARSLVFRNTYCFFDFSVSIYVLCWLLAVHLRIGGEHSLAEVCDIGRRAVDLGHK